MAAWPKASERCAILKMHKQPNLQLASNLFVTWSDKKGLIAFLIALDHSFRKLIVIFQKFLDQTLLCGQSQVCKIHWHRPTRKKVMSSQSKKTGKEISPFFSDQVDFLPSKHIIYVIIPKYGRKARGHTLLYTSIAHELRVSQK